MGSQFATMAAVGLPGVVGLLFEVAELQGAFVFGGAEFDPAFAGRVVEDKLVVAALPAPAGIELLAFEAGEAGVVGMGAVFLASKEGRRIGAGLHGTAADPIALGIGAAAPVIGRADDDRAVDVAVLEGNKDFLAGTGNEMAAPVGAGDRGHDAEPDA